MYNWTHCEFSLSYLFFRQNFHSFFFLLLNFCFCPANSADFVKDLWESLNSFWKLLPSLIKHWDYIWWLIFSNNRYILYHIFPVETCGWIPLSSWESQHKVPGTHHGPGWTVQTSWEQRPSQHSQAAQSGRRPRHPQTWHLLPGVSHTQASCRSTTFNGRIEGGVSR